ncbi:MAG: glutamine cyclotransferase [Halieaceae bacterium]|jgi:glutamine cyclotransferase
MASKLKPLSIIVLCFAANISRAANQIEYEVLARYPHARTHFTQGLEVYENRVYESTGLYGKSQIMHYALADPAAAQSRKLGPKYFGEGLTVLNGRLYQLTWRSGEVFVYDPSDLTELDSFSIESDGWGLTNNGRELIYTTGSDELVFLNPESRKVLRRVKVSLQGEPVKQLNELEWIDGRIFANVLPSNLIVVIDPDTGSVLSTLNLEKLYPYKMRKSSSDIANGIAWDADRRELLVTGKNWPWIFRLRLLSQH